VDEQKKRKEIISQLIEARLAKGISQAELARQIGTQRSNICRIESGAQNLTLDMVLKIASALGKDMIMCLEDRADDREDV
jgi:transcriptional regulator with XRE-family HTH domain